MLATALTTNYLTGYAVQLGELTTPLRLAGERPRAFPQNVEEAFEEVSKKITPGLVQFFPSSSGAFLNAQQAVLSGAVLTSDGWILTYPEAGQSVAGMQAVIGVNVFRVEEVVPDPQTGAMFVKVNAGNLQVVPFGNGWDISAGEQLIVVPSVGHLLQTSAIGSDWGEEIEWSSDVPRRRIQVDAVQVDQGSPVSNLVGELVGIAHEENGRTFVLPMESVLGAFTSLLRGGRIERPSLGVETVDLTRNTTTEEQTRGRRSGAFLLDAGSVERGSPAAEAGLQGGDIILAVDGRIINGTRTLDEYISGYVPGDSITLTVDRDGEEISLQATLDVL